MDRVHFEKDEDDEPVKRAWELEQVHGWDFWKRKTRAFMEIELS